MNVKIEASTLTIGKDGAVLKAFNDGKWGIRFTVEAGQESNNRYEFTVTPEEAQIIKSKIDNAIREINKAKVISFNMSKEQERP